MGNGGENENIGHAARGKIISNIGITKWKTLNHNNKTSMASAKVVHSFCTYCAIIHVHSLFIHICLQDSWALLRLPSYVCYILEHCRNTQTAKKYTAVLPDI